ncbi:MAG: flavin-containing monooxygenase [Segniliparus sp.]|uniref:flavin-containing monooxygenase n=1 Tax=Segniliparus sp. TaxID=2804064 RepID=UPI003F358ED2
MADNPDVTVLVIGAGLGGICAAVRLREMGIDDYLVIDREDGLGGTWLKNRYPGVAVDIPSVLYQYSFAVKLDWSRVFAPGHEVLDYLEKLVSERGLLDKFRFGVEVVKETWDGENNWWSVETRDGRTITARFVISSLGPFLDPKSGDGIPGLADFKGVHASTASWRDDYDLRGKRVGVIGTGATGVQLVAAVAPLVGSLVVFQRSAAYALPKPDAELGRRAHRVLALPGVTPALRWTLRSLFDVFSGFFRIMPFWLATRVFKSMDALALKHYPRYLRRVVDDPETAAALAPSHGFMTHRPTLNSEYPRAFNLPHVKLETNPIDSVTEKGVRTIGGTEYEFDYLVTALGFSVFSEPKSYLSGRVIGRDGVDLGQYFNTNGMRAFDSVAVPGFPNRWMVVGPYSWVGSTWHDVVELAVAHASRALEVARRSSAVSIEVKRSAERDFHEKMRREAKSIEYYLADLHAGETGYYVNSQNEAPIFRFGSFRRLMKYSQKVGLESYEIVV